MPSRTGLGGNIDCISPFLDHLARDSLYFSNAFTMGNPTEFALPGLFASSYLLDAGGFRHGISNREITLAEVFKKKGYITSAFFTIFRPQKDNYDRGFDSFFHLYDLQVTEKNFLNTANWYLSQYNKKVLSLSECIEELYHYYYEFLNDVIYYCKTWIGYAKNELLPKSNFLSVINHEKVAQLIEAEIIILENSPKTTLEPFFHGGTLALSRIIRDQVRERKKKSKLSIYDIRFRNKILWSIPKIYKSSTSFHTAKNSVALAVDRVLHGSKNYLMRYPTGSYVLETFKRWHRQIDQSQPFYSYIKLLDAHEYNFSSHDWNQNELERQEEYKIFKDCLRKISLEKNFRGNLLYDISIRYVDKIIERLFNFLKKEQILDNTIVVVTADHGGSYPNIPVREKNAHRVNQFYDELYRIPLLFANKDLTSKQYSNLVSSVDIGPTLLDMLGESTPESFRGRSLISGNERSFVISENQGRGPCDLKRKPILLCVRSSHYKLVYKKPPGENKDGFVDQIYDLHKDPAEMNNLKMDQVALGNCTDLLMIAKKRTEEILS